MPLPSRLVAPLRRIRSAGVITGAGVSAESGVPTYRGRGGLYEDDGAMAEALSGPALRADPDRTWRAIGEIARRAAGGRSRTRRTPRSSGASGGSPT